MDRGAQPSRGTSTAATTSAAWLATFTPDERDTTVHVAQTRQRRVVVGAVASALAAVLYAVGLASLGVDVLGGWRLLAWLAPVMCVLGAIGHVWLWLLWTRIAGVFGDVGTPPERLAKVNRDGVRAQALVLPLHLAPFTLPLIPIEAWGVWVYSAVVLAVVGIGANVGAKPTLQARGSATTA